MRRTSPLLSALLFVPGLCAASSFAGPDQQVCGTSTVLEADALGTGESGFWSVVQGNAFFTNASSPSSGATQLEFGENVLMWTIISPAGTTTDLVSIWCYNALMPMANAGPDQTVSSWPGTVQLNGSTPVAPGTCVWTVVLGGGSFTDPYDPNTTVSNLAPGQSAFQWNCENGPCGNSEDAITIDVVVGIAENTGANVGMWYDPVHHQLVFARQSTWMSLELFDRQGSSVQQLSTPAGAGVWDLSAMPSGIYLARARTPDGVFAERFVVEH